MNRAKRVRLRLDYIAKKERIMRASVEMLLAMHKEQMPSVSVVEPVDVYSLRFQLLHWAAYETIEKLVDG